MTEAALVPACGPMMQASQSLPIPARGSLVSFPLGFKASG